VAISFSRPDPSSPASVAEAAFSTGRRGFDQQEVRDFLRMVAAELARLQERERFLERELRTAQANPVSTEGLTLDDETATRLLGEEAARVLQTAREGGAAIRGRAEDGAAQLLREAGDEARRVREQAELEAARKRSDAAADAESELAMAKQQGREMVEEARAYRERVLGELSRRRDLARAQIEQLVHGRDRLLQAFERARLVAVDVTAELSPLGEPDEYVDLSPTTGPVPIMVPSGRIGDASSVDDFVPRTPDVEADGPEAAADDAARDDAEQDVAEPEPVEAVDEVDEVDAVDEPVEVDAVDEPVEVAPDETHATVFPFPQPPERTEPADDTVEDGSDEAASTESDDGGDAEIDDDDVTATDVDALFAKLRSTPIEVDPELDEDTDVVADDVEETPFRIRDAALVPLIVAAARKVKRVLADEQNDVLDTLRRTEPVRDIDALVPAAPDQAVRYSDAITAEIATAVAAGAASVGGGEDIDIGPDGPLGVVRAHITSELVGPLRDRLERGVVDGEGVNDTITKRIRGVYREWKTQRIDEQLDDTFRLAYCQGALAALGSGSAVIWSVDPDGPPSPDCEDNGLAGVVASGDAFPSGHIAPPMHPGCRCLLLRSDR
jgi:DivIVA domain-containing protein